MGGRLWHCCGLNWNWVHHPDTCTGKYRRQVFAFRISPSSSLCWETCWLCALGCDSIRRIENLIIVYSTRSQSAPVTGGATATLSHPFCIRNGKAFVFWQIAVEARLNGIWKCFRKYNYPQTDWNAHYPDSDAHANRTGWERTNERTTSKKTLYSISYSYFPVSAFHHFLLKSLFHFNLDVFVPRMMIPSAEPGDLFGSAIRRLSPATTSTRAFKLNGIIKLDEVINY